MQFCTESAHWNICRGPCCVRSRRSTGGRLQCRWCVHNNSTTSRGNIHTHTHFHGAKYFYHNHRYFFLSIIISISKCQLLINVAFALAGIQLLRHNKHKAKMMDMKPIFYTLLCLIVYGFRRCMIWYCRMSPCSPVCMSDAWCQERVPSPACREPANTWRYCGHPANTSHNPGLLPTPTLYIIQYTGRAES